MDHDTAAMPSYTTRRTITGGLAVEFTCPKCERQYKADALTDADKLHQCECGQSVRIPGREEAERFVASRKQQRLEGARRKQQKQTPRTTPQRKKVAAAVPTGQLVRVENPIELGMQAGFAARA